MNILLFIYYILILIGISYLCGLILSRILHFNKTYHMFIGFSLAPVFLSYGGFVGIWKFSLLQNVLGIGLALYGAFLVLRMLFSERLLISQNIKLWIIPALLIVLFMLSKSSHLKGGLSDGDEFRSILLTSAFATNSLKPAFPFDLSLPIVYPYYAFETSAFLYSSINGLLYPSIPVFAVSVFILTCFYYGIFIISKKLFGNQINERFLLTCLLVTFSSFAGLKALFSMKVNPEIQLMNITFHSGYHYLWGSLLAIFAILHLYEYIKLKQKKDWALFILFMSFSATFSGYPFAWASLSGILLIATFLYHEKLNALKMLIQNIPLSVGIFAPIALPQLFSFLPRMAHNFWVSAPHFWFARSTDQYFEEYNVFKASTKALAYGLDTLISKIGIFLLIALIISTFIAIKQLFNQKIDNEWGRMYPLTISVLVSVLILTFTRSGSGDWVGRGFIFTTIVLSFPATLLVSKAIKHNKLVLVAFVPLLALQLVSVVIEHNKGLQGASDEVIELNKTYPLGTIFHKSKLLSQLSYDEEIDSELISTVTKAGRSALIPTTGHAAYLSRYELLKKLGAGKIFKPCSSTLYGKSTPNGKYVIVQNNTFINKECESQ